MSRAKLTTATEFNDVLDDFRRQVPGARSPKSCKQQAWRIGAVAKRPKDSAQAKEWFGALAKEIDGRETYQAQRNGKAPRASAAEIIGKLMAAT